MRKKHNLDQVSHTEPEGRSGFRAGGSACGEVQPLPPQGKGDCDTCISQGWEIFYNGLPMKTWIQHALEDFRIPNDSSVEDAVISWNDRFLKVLDMIAPTDFSQH